MGDFQNQLQKQSELLLNADDLDAMWVCLRENCVIDDATGAEKVRFFLIHVFYTTSICKVLVLVACLNVSILVSFWAQRLTANSYMRDLHLCFFSFLCSTPFIIISPFLISSWNTADEL